MYSTAIITRMFLLHSYHHADVLFNSHICFADKLRQLSQHLRGVFEEVLADGDIFTAARALELRSVFTLSFACGDRGSETGKLRTVNLMTGKAPGLVTIDFEAVDRGTDLTFAGRGKKQSRSRTTAAYDVPRSTDPDLDAGPILLDYLAFMGDCEFVDLSPPTGTPSFVFPRVQRGSTSFVNLPFTSAAIRYGLRKYLTVLDLYAGETAHSLTRGGRIVSPLSNEELATKLSLTAKTIALYRDIRR